MDITKLIKKAKRFCVESSCHPRVCPFLKKKKAETGRVYYDCIFADPIGDWDEKKVSKGIKKLKKVFK